MRTSRALLSLLLPAALAAQQVIVHPEAGCLPNATVFVNILPTVGGTLSFGYDGMDDAEPTIFLGGTFTFSDVSSQFPGWPTPCYLENTLLATHAAQSIGGHVKITLHIPNNPALLGADIFFQGFQSGGLTVAAECIVG